MHTAASDGPGLTQELIDMWLARVAAERARRSPPPDFPALPDLPGARYSDAGFFALERERLWRRAWLYAGHVDQLPVPGSYFLSPYGSAPIALMRGDDGEIRAFYNTCRHRGAPVLRDWGSFDPACRSLVPVRTGRWGNWLFVCEDPQAETLENFLAPLAARLDHLPLTEFRLIDRRIGVAHVPAALRVQSVLAG